MASQIRIELHQQRFGSFIFVDAEINRQPRIIGNDERLLGAAMSAARESGRTFFPTPGEVRALLPKYGVHTLRVYSGPTDLYGQKLPKSGGSPPPLTEAQRTEIDRRLETHQREPKAGSPWEEVKQRTSAKPGFQS